LDATAALSEPNDSPPWSALLELIGTRDEVERQIDAMIRLPLTASGPRRSWLNRIKVAGL
jgi:hypothetical protein